MTEEHVISDRESCETLAVCLTDGILEQRKLADELYAELLATEKSLVCAAQMILNNPGMYDQIVADNNPECAVQEGSPAMLVVSKETEQNVEVMFVFPVENEKGESPKYTPHVVRFDANTLLNMARMVAMQHQRMLMPEAQLADNVPGIIVPEHLKN